MAARMWKALALSASLAVLLSGCLSSSPPPGSPGPNTLPETSPPPPAPWPPLGPPPPGFVNVFVIEATLNVTRDDNLSADLGVDLIRLPHCAFVYPDANTAKLRVERLFDPNTTAVILVRYTDRTSFSGGGDDTAVFMVTGAGNVSVPAALNRSGALYNFATASSSFSPALNATSQAANSVKLTYRVEGALTLYPDFYPQQTGVFKVEEWHTLVSQFVAELDVRGGGGCD